MDIIILILALSALHRWPPSAGSVRSIQIHPSRTALQCVHQASRSAPVSRHIGAKNDRTTEQKGGKKEETVELLSAGKYKTSAIKCGCGGCRV